MERRNKKTKSVGNGEGSLYFSEKLNCYVYQYYYDGKRKTLKQKKGEQAKEFKNRVTTIKNSLNTGTYISKNNITIYQLGLEIIENKFNRNKISEATYCREVETLNHIKTSSLKNIQIQKVSIQQLQNFMDSKKKYANSYIDKIYEMLGRIFKESLKRGYILKNPMLNVEKPKSDKLDTKIEALSVDEQKSFLKILAREPEYKNIFIIALYTGMRMGEILALQKDDIDFKQKVIKIHRSLTKTMNGKTKIGDKTKTYNSTRTIPITPLFENNLKDAIKNMKLNVNNLLFVQSNGQLYSVANMNSRFKRICANANLGVVPYIIKRRKKRDTF